MDDDTRRILIYDGDCAFCTSATRWIEAKWDAQHAARTVAFQRLTVTELAGFSLTPADVAGAAWWIDEEERSRGHLAVARALLAAGGWWRVLGSALLIPPFRWIGAVGYSIVVRFRHRLPGATPACER